MERPNYTQIARDVAPRALAVLTFALLLSRSASVARGTEGSNSQPTQPEATPTPYSLFTPDYRRSIEELIVTSTPTPTIDTITQQLRPVSSVATATPTRALRTSMDNSNDNRDNDNNSNDNNSNDNDNRHNDNNRNQRTKNPTATRPISCMPVSTEPNQPCGPQLKTRVPAETPTATPTPNEKRCILGFPSKGCPPETPAPRTRVPATETPTTIVMTITPTKRPTFTITSTPSRSCVLPISNEHCRPPSGTPGQR